MTNYCNSYSNEDHICLWSSMDPDFKASDDTIQKRFLKGWLHVDLPLVIILNCFLTNDKMTNVGSTHLQQKFWLWLPPDSPNASHTVNSQCIFNEWNPFWVDYSSIQQDLALKFQWYLQPAHLSPLVTHGDLNCSRPVSLQGPPPQGAQLA